LTHSCGNAFQNGENDGDQNVTILTYIRHIDHAGVVWSRGLWGNKFDWSSWLPSVD